MADEKKTDKETENVKDDAKTSSAKTSKTSKTSEKTSAKDAAEPEKEAPESEGAKKPNETAKAAREKAAQAARRASEEAAKAAAAAREEASKSYEGAKSSIADSDDRTIAIVSYALNLATFVTAGVAALVAVIFAYLKKDTDDPVLANHFEYLVRTFWIGLAAIGIMIVSFITIILIPLGVLISLLLGIWWLLRNVIGLVRLLDGKPHPDPKTWLV